jgi:polysaccharide deacetylase family protein (PEP-CTERM system associated)
MNHKLTFDLEEWFHPYFYRQLIPINKWEKSLSRAKIQSEIVLNLLKDYEIKATFFIVGWITDNFPEIIEKIKSEGHQIGIHSYYHTPLFLMNSSEFEKDLVLCLRTFEKVLNEVPTLFRAPNFSIRKDTLWALDILKKNGIKYDSSFHPTFYHPDYSNKNRLTLADFEQSGIKEYPIAALKLGTVNIPFAGGAYFRYYPKLITKMIWDKFQKAETSITFYLHPWELDKDLPDSKLRFIVNLRTRYNIDNNMKKFEFLLRNYNFTTLIDNLEN